ncbi:glycoside hydrolase family 71/99-like protein [Rhodopseudomonas palustris]|uniref:glycoside hydrolase family 71/99-like protein n=1 Tax=Rhodopseudomonas palustris TaxID=1076 RepID=UPI0010590EAA|nr:glycoside hydrolase family 71/99-like protein [Rhodopseudomonas palustris]QLH71663.1 xylosidase/arabinosidase [Rhodopseudomonas palustris]
MLFPVLRKLVCFAAGAFVATFACLSTPARATEVDPTTLDGKMIFGYQGWFGCPGDAAGRGWVHWKLGERPTVDLLPDVSELEASELCDSGWTTADGRPIKLFSSQNPITVDRHFKWMKNYGLDGVALQKFAATLLDPMRRVSVDRVLANVRKGAARHGRIYFLMYDLTGMPPDKLGLVTDDWKRLLGEGIASERAYLHHNGRPVLGLWGIGLSGSAAALTLLDSIRAESNSTGGVILLGGVPAMWRDDIERETGLAEVWRKLDVISPWTVGRYADDAGADEYRARSLVPDMYAAGQLKSQYMPVVFPGFSWSNLQSAHRHHDKAIFNQIPRRCGAFYLRQVMNVVQSGARMAYTAMFDEVDEGTAMFKLVSRVADSPSEPRFLTLDADRCGTDSDLYLKLGSKASDAIRKMDASLLNR